VSAVGFIKSDWDSEPHVQQACLNILKGLKKSLNHPEHYTFRDLAALSNTDDEVVVSKALLYLAAPRIKILKARLMYEWDGFFHDLPDDEVENYSKGEEVVHPQNGEPLDSSQILISFILGDALVKREVS
jgi:hypothetical protein